jgi:hypothetical protein
MSQKKGQAVGLGLFVNYIKLFYFLEVNTAE